jgi:[ribosomal protein S5]-alanine N-acetyltransferase
VTDPSFRARASVNAWGREAWKADGFAPWAVVEKTSARLIGHLGLRYLSEINETELLYLIDEPWWGQGLATEGGHAAVRFAREQLRASHLVAFIVPENIASISVVGKLGFRRDGEQSIFGLNAWRFVLPLVASA